MIVSCHNRLKHYFYRLVILLLLVIGLVPSRAIGQVQLQGYIGTVTDVTGIETELEQLRFEKRRIHMAYRDGLPDSFLYIPIRYKSGYLRIPFEKINKIERVEFVDELPEEREIGLIESSIVAKVFLHDGTILEGIIQDVPSWIYLGMAIAGEFHNQYFTLNIPALQLLTIDSVPPPENEANLTPQPLDVQSAIIETLSGEQISVTNPHVLWEGVELQESDAFDLTRGSGSITVKFSEAQEITILPNDSGDPQNSVNVPSSIVITLRDGTSIEGTNGGTFALSIGGTVEHGEYFIQLREVRSVKFN